MDAVRRIADALPPFDGVRHLYGFASDARSLTHADSLRFDGARTDITRALVQVRQSLENENLRGILLISDGRFTTGRNPVHAAERYGVPVHTVVVGDTLRRRDLQVRRVTANEIAYVDQEVPVRVLLRVEGADEEVVSVALVQGSDVLSTESLRLPSGNAEIETDLSWTPTSEGLHRLAVVVARLSNEATYRNNVESIAVRVLKSRRRVLLLAAAPDPDLASVTALLRSAGDADVSQHVQKSPGTYYAGPPSTSFAEFDLIVLVGFPGTGADPAILSRITGAAADGIPVLFLAGRYTDPSAVKRIGAALPAVPTQVRGGFDEVSIILTAEGTQHPVFDIALRTPDLDGLPPLLRNRSDWALSPESRVLARIGIRGVELDDPLVVVRSRGGSRSAALLGSGFWRWHNLPEDLDEYSRVWPLVLSNLVQWLTTPKDDRPVRVRPTEDGFGGGESVQFAGQVYDESLNPVADASVSVDISAPDGITYPHAMDIVENGRYELDIGALPEGSYRYEAEATLGGVSLGKDKGAFTVGALTLEFKDMTTDAALMRQIALRSGGRFFTEASLSDLPGTLVADSLFRSVVHETSMSTNLWQHTLFLAFVILLLSTEWVVRKRRGLP